MLFAVDGMTLDLVRVISAGRYNDVAVCRDSSSPLEVYYTLIIIKDRDCARNVLTALEEKCPGERGEAYNVCFAYNDSLCYLFPYRPERPLERFAPAQITNPCQWEEICINLVMECLSAKLPHPLLALALESGNVHIEKDNSVYFSYFFDLGQLNSDDDESACARRCAEMMLSLLDPGAKKVKSAKLMTKKLSRNAFRNLSELYRDIKVSALPQKKPGFKARMQAFWQRNKDRLFRLLLVLCVIILSCALVMGLMHIFLGNIPLFRLFENSFGTIGTRRLG